MKISSLNANSPSFGKVQRSAAIFALAQTQGKRLATWHVKRLIAKQASNKVIDIAFVPQFRRFRLQNNITGKPIYDLFDQLEAACEIATIMKKESLKKAKTLQRLGKSAYKIFERFYS